MVTVYLGLACMTIKYYYYIKIFITDMDKFSSKEKTQYSTAILFLLSGIVMSFLSFFLNEYDIENGVLLYLSQGTAFCAAVFGLNVFIKNKVLEVESRLNNKIDTKMRKVDNLIKD